MRKIKAFFNSVEEFRSAFASEDKTFVYARGAEPSVEKFNQLLARLEGTESALSFASGVGAISSVLFAFLKAGDHIIFHKHSYSWARYLIQNHCHKFGITHTEIEEKEIPSIEKYIRQETKMIYIENPSYFYFESLALAQVFELGKSKSILTVLDNSYLGPANLKPHLQKFDIILHSATKIICGKGDTLGGVVCTSEKLRKVLFKDGLMSIGAVMTSAVAELLTERMENYFERTAKISREMKIFFKYLKNHPKISKIHYPWDLDKADNWIEHSDYLFPVGLLSFELNTQNQGQVEKFVDSLRLVKKGVSYGSTEALIIPSVLFLKKGSQPLFPLGICRFSIGEQAASDIINDFESAFIESKI